MVSVKVNNDIELTRGDSLVLDVVISSDNGSYVPSSGDSIRFAMKKHYTDEECVINKDIPNDTMQLKIDPSDTKSLDFGKYVYDMQLTTSAGVVNTFVSGNFYLLEEVE